jgi:hypothetical protein
MRINYKIIVLIISIMLLCNSLLSDDSKNYKLIFLNQKIKKAKNVNEILDSYKRNDIIRLKELYYSGGIGERALIRHLSGVFTKYPIIDELEECYKIHKEKTKNMNLEDKKRYLFNYILKDWKSYEELQKYRYKYGKLIVEGAILNIIEIEGIYKDLEKILLDNTIVPQNEKECLTKGSDFANLMDVVKSIREGKMLLDKVEKLMNSNVRCVKESAFDAYQWLSSGVIYPFKYQRIIDVPDDVSFSKDIKECHLW